jgi:hypothetical protein
MDCEVWYISRTAGDEANLSFNKALRTIHQERARHRSMDKLLFWLGLGAAQKAAGSKPTAHRHPVTSFVVGVLIALLIAAGVFVLLVSQQ